MPEQQTAVQEMIETIEDKKLLQILENTDNLTDLTHLKNAFEDHKTELTSIEALAEEKTEEQTSELNLQTHMEGVDHSSKTELAHAYADWQIKQNHTIPVVIDNSTLFFRYNPESKTWNQIDLDMILKEVSRDLGNKPIDATVTRHLHNEFSKKMKTHHHFVDWSKFGLKPEQVLMKNGKILELEDIEEDSENRMHKVTREAEKTDYAINAVNAVYNPDADKEIDTPLEDFIINTIPDDQEREAFQQFLGFCLMWPSDRFEKSLLVLGPTDSGKSTLLKVVKEFFSESNTTEISFPQLGQERAFHVENLKQSVLNFDHDMAEKGLKQRSRVKKIISKEEIFADPKSEKGYTMKPTANFMIASNHPPNHEGADEAFLKRFLTVEAPETITEEEKDRDLIDKITTDKSLEWLLRWAVDGYESLQTMNKFAVNRNPAETKEMWAKYGGTVSRFLNQQVERGGEGSQNVPTKHLYYTYQKWCEDNFEKAEAFQTFVSKATDYPTITKDKVVPYGGETMNRRMCFKDVSVNQVIERDSH